MTMLYILERRKHGAGESWKWLGATFKNVEDARAHLRHEEQADLHYGDDHEYQIVRYRRDEVVAHFWPNIEAQHAAERQQQSVGEEIHDRAELQRLLEKYGAPRALEPGLLATKTGESIADPANPSGRGEIAPASGPRDGPDQ